MPRRSTAALITTLCLACASAQAQDGATPMNPDNAALAYFLGTWDVSLTFTLPGGREGQGRAECRTDVMLDGAFLRREYRSTFRGQSLVIQQVLGHDGQRRAFVEFWLHVGGGAPTQTRRLEGSFSGGGRLLTLEGEARDPFTGQPVRLRTVTTIVDPDRYDVEEWFVLPDGREERRVVLRHTRVR